METQEAPTIVQVYSLTDEARQEAQAHKWIESQKRGYDLGELAIREWYRKYWPGFWRHRRVEHLRGSKCCKEFDRAVYGRLFDLIVKGDLLTDRVLDRVYAGYENLDILQWAHAWGLPADRVVQILAMIDVNRGRLEQDVV